MKEYTSRDTLLSYTSFSALKYSQLPFFHCNGLKVRKLYVCARKEERKDERKEVGCSGLKVHKLYCGKFFYNLTNFTIISQINCARDTLLPD